MKRQFIKYAQLAMLFVLGMTGSMFAQGSSAPQPTPATRFGLPTAKPATTVATPLVPASTITTTAANQPLSAKTAAGPIVSSNTSPLSVSAAMVVYTQLGVPSSTAFHCSKFVFSAVNTPSVGTTAPGAGKATLNATFTKPWDAAPDPFFAALVAGGHFDSVNFTFVDPAGRPVYTVGLKTVMVKSIDKGFDATTGAAVEEVSLIFGAFKMQDAAGNSGINPTTAKDSWVNVP